MTKWFIGDTHFGHSSTWEKFKRPDGTPLRNFTSTEEMDETLIQNWNKVVKPTDVVIHMGDVVINRRYLPIVHRLNGRKRLVRGNHDIFDIEDYQKAGFEEIYGVYVLKGPNFRVICSHIPLHPDSLMRWTQNWHGHLHFGVVRDSMGVPDKRYRNLSCEMIDFTPVSYEQLVEELDDSGQSRPHPR